MKDVEDTSQRCYDCGYNLTGLSEQRCPECGKLIGESDEECRLERGETSDLLRLVCVVSVILAVLQAGPVDAFCVVLPAQWLAAIGGAVLYLRASDEVKSDLWLCALAVAPFVLTIGSCVYAAPEKWPC